MHLVRSSSMFSLSSLDSTGEDEHVEKVLPEDLLLLERKVRDLIEPAKIIHSERLESEVTWFFRHLGLDQTYFHSTSANSISSHITGLYAAKLLNAAMSNESLSLRLIQETADEALYIVPSRPKQSSTPSSQIELQIEREYLREGSEAPATSLGEGGSFRVQVYRTRGCISENSSTRLRLFFVKKCRYDEEEEEGTLKGVADTKFLKHASAATQESMKQLVSKATEEQGPVFQVVEDGGKDSGGLQQVKLMVAYRRGTTQRFYSGLTDLYHAHGLHSTRKYLETYKNGICSYSLYLVSDPTDGGPSTIDRVRRVASDLSLLYVLPVAWSCVPVGNKLSASEIVYAYAASKFAHQFLSSIGEQELESISRSLDAYTAGVLSKVRAGLKREALTERRITAIAHEYPAVLSRLFSDFKARVGPGRTEDPSEEVVSELLSVIRREAVTELDARVLTSMLVFNRHVLKTNFFKDSKVALSFRLEPSFLSRADYPDTPYAVFFVIGSEFRGFHVRFVDVARGGIRVIRSGNDSAYGVNVATLFDENYNLALTQQRKNKDIPEGGSKGTILLSRNAQGKAEVAFRKYVDAILDILLPGDKVVDRLGQPELLFLGPDEGTADFMNWASRHARSRGYAFWKAFTTGKSRSTGGIPHDYYGMTTRSIHQFVVGILRKNGLDESAVRKLQTGGPDGDLGSNEIKISHDKTVAIVDGSGVLYDPSGIDREELLRLANARQMISHFDMRKLTDERAFRVLVDEVDVTLPCGRVLEKGLLFRNSFHLETALLSGIDLFVPCGGRPAAVNVNNVQYLFDDNGQPIFRFVVEGANLFFTQEARLQLEKKGCVLFKDASANKGGVTSSSLEVLAALALTDEEFEQHMMVTDDASPPPFYEEYVRDVISIIEKHAHDEFERLWSEHERTGRPRCVLTDELSTKINELNHSIVQSSLWNDETLRSKVIGEAVPSSLIRLIGLEQLLSRVPSSYLKAIFGAHLACSFVYSKGMNAGAFGFFEFMQEYKGV